MEAHEDFVKSTVGQAFLEDVGNWLAGPPTVKHYMLGSISSETITPWVILESARTSAIEASSAVDLPRASVTAIGQEVEDGTVALRVSFFPAEDALKAQMRILSSHDEGFGIHIQILRESRAAARL